MDTSKHQEIADALMWRYATKIFDPKKKVDDKDLHSILESGRLAPSSVGFEPWKFIVVLDMETRIKLRAASFDQPKVTDASHFIVIARRTNTVELIDELIARTAKAQNKKEEELSGYRKMAEGMMTMRPEWPALDGWLAAQAYIPLGMMVETASLLGIDNCPMEGFNPSQVDEILHLREKGLASVVALAIGYRGEDPQMLLPKTRRSFDEAVEFVR